MSLCSLEKKKGNTFKKCGGCAWRAFNQLSFNSIVIITLCSDAGVERRKNQTIKDSK